MLRGAPGLLCPLPCIVGILLGHASLIFHSLQVPLQLVDRQVNESTLVLVTLAFHAALIVLGTRLLSSGRRCHL
jgi:hypothetical protein